ncbi:MAG: sigma-54 dependent transcriptional regulator [Deltaproteobacteria bacterium]
MSPVIGGLRRCSRIVAESPAMRALLVRAAPIAGADASVVLLGESGSGKEVLARALHANGPRRSKPFVPVNVAALPADLLESELFGHARGAFTGATQAHRGLFLAAEGGTLFLDEIGEMPLPLQAKLLRALQDGEIRHVGDSTSFSVDVRIVCATHADLRGLVAQSRFREDLYYRLKVFALTVPPLRERVEDIMPLAQMFLERERYEGPGFTPKARRALEQHTWSGNVRELANAVKHGAVLAMGGPIGPEHLPEEVTHPTGARPAGKSMRTLADVEREHVLRVLEACGGQQSEAARVLGIARNTLWRKMKAFGLGAAG